jgi:integrase
MGAAGRDSSPAGIRDAALIGVLYGAGLRRSESVRLDLADYNIETGELTIRGAKGRKDRLGYATNGSADALKDWLVTRGGGPGPLFCRINKGGRITIHRLTDQAVLHVLKKRAVQASVASFSPHDFDGCSSRTCSMPVLPFRRRNNWLVMPTCKPLLATTGAVKRQNGKRRNCCMVFEAQGEPIAH